MIIGAPKNLSAYAPLTTGEVEHLVPMLEQAIANGAPPEMQAAVDFGVLCRLVTTCRYLHAKVTTLKAPLPEIPKFQPSSEAVVVQTLADISNGE